MKTAVKIFALILAAALCAGLFSCASVPTPLPAVTETDTAEATGVPDTTGVPETGAVTTAAGTSAPDTKAPETTNVPVTTPAVTTAPVTTQAPETTTAPEWGHWNVTGNGFLLTGDWQDTDPDDLPAGILEPFYRIDENTVGVRGFDEIRLSVHGTYVDSKERTETSIDGKDKGILPQNYRFLMPPEYRAFALTYLPEVLPRPDAFFLTEEVRPQLEYIFHLSESCLLHYNSNAAAMGIHHMMYVMNDPNRTNITSTPSGMKAEEYYIPIYRSEDGKEVRFAFRYECDRHRYLYPNYLYSFTSIVDICSITLSNDLKSIVSIDSLITLRPGKTQQLVFSGKYGFLSACTMTIEENGETTDYYTFFGTADGGKTWVCYDPQTPDTPEFTATRPGKEYVEYTNG